MNRFFHTTIRSAACLAALALPIAACSSDDEPAEPAEPAPTTQPDSSEQSPDQSDQSDGADTGSNDALPDDGSFGLDLETRVGALEGGLSFDDYEIDGTTLTLTFSEGTNELDGPVDCIIGGGAMGDDETLVLEYPDGSTTC